jgi:hypothetical protein
MLMLLMMKRLLRKMNTSQQQAASLTMKWMRSVLALLQIPSLKTKMMKLPPTATARL